MTNLIVAFRNFRTVPKNFENGFLVFDVVTDHAIARQLVTGHSPRRFGSIPAQFCGFCDGKNGSVRGCSLRSSVFSCLHDFTSVPYSHFIHIPPTLYYATNCQRHQITPLKDTVQFARHLPTFSATSIFGVEESIICLVYTA
jgi:hypothetical protein